MKTFFSFGFVAALSFLVLACKSDSSTSSNDNTAVSGTGADYFPIHGNDVVTARFRGSLTVYGLGGAIQERDTINQDRTAFASSVTSRNGLSFFSILGYDDTGVPSGRPDIFLGSTDGQVLGVGRRDDPGMILPSTLSVGATWNPDPNGVPAYKAVLVEHLGTFTNSIGNTYSDVIRVDASIIDSTETFDSYNQSTHVAIRNATGTVYFAKGIGPIEARVDHAEYHDYSKTQNGIKDFSQRVLSGSASRK